MAVRLIAGVAVVSVHGAPDRRRRIPGGSARVPQPSTRFTDLQGDYTRRGYGKLKRNRRRRGVRIVGIGKLLVLPLFRFVSYPAKLLIADDMWACVINF